MNHECRSEIFDIGHSQEAAGRSQLYRWVLDYLSKQHEKQLLEYLQDHPKEFFGKVMKFAAK